MITKYYPLLLSSDPKDGATNITNNGSEFDTPFDVNNTSAVIVDENAESCFLYVIDAEFFYTFPNINTGVNDQITITYTDGGPLETYNITIPQGLYSVDDLNSQLTVELLNQVGYGETSPLIELIGSDPQQKVLIKYNYDGVRVDLTGAKTFRELIGFDSGLYPTAGNSTANTFDTANSVAKFNTVRYVLISCSLVDDGMKVGVNFDSYICRILLDVEPGRQKTYVPPIKIPINASSMIGKKVSKVRTRMVDQNGESLDTNDEFFSVNVILEYQVPRF